MFTDTKAVCSVYDGRLNSLLLPEPDYMFLRTLESMPAVYNADKYFDFLDFYGTHYVT